jgi:RNA chaperone Hfq
MEHGHGSRTCAKSARHFSQSRPQSKIPLTIFLVNGVKLQGVVTWFDNFCVLLRRDGHSQLVYKHAISTIMPGHPIQLFEGGEEPPAGAGDKA